MWRASLALAILLPGPNLAQDHLLDPRVRDLLAEELSGEIAKEHVIAITRFHRIQGSRGYRQAAEYVLAKLREYGFGPQDAWIESFTSDGKVVYQTWQSPPGWDVESAELRMVEPQDELIVRFPEIAMSLITYSNAGAATAELVDVGAGTSDADYAGKDVKGRFVLATGYGGAVHRLAVLKYDAAAVVCYLADERAAEHPDMLQYTGMWPKTDELERTTFGFNLTNRQGERLRELLASGTKVVLHGEVKGTGLEPFFTDVVVAKIDGRVAPQDELVFSAHLDHPKESANDNASGSGAILDVARGLKSLIRAARLQRPEKTLRFLWVPEWNGTMAYIDAHPEFCGPELGGNVLANVNLDMVGENQELLHSRLILTRTPHSLPSVLNDVIEDMAEMVDAMDIRTPRGSLSTLNWKMTPYSGGSDHMMMIDRKIPAVMFSHAPDYTHHTSEDTPDKVDPVTLERCELLAAGALWHLANLNTAQAMALAERAASRALGRITAVQVRGDLFHPSPSAYSEAEERRALTDLSRFESTTATAALVRELGRDLQRAWSDSMDWPRFASTPGLVGVIPLPRAEIPRRTTRGPLAFDLPERRLSPARTKELGASLSRLSGDVRFEIVNFVDGARSLAEIGREVSSHYADAQASDVETFVLALVEVGALDVGPGLGEIRLSPRFEAADTILPMRWRAKLEDDWLTKRLDTIVPALMQREKIDMWILVAREYDEDPVVETMLPATWFSARRRTILVFHDPRAKDPKASTERFAVARYDVGTFAAQWNPEEQPDQWKRLAELVAARDPKRIAIDVSPTFALADGMSVAEYEALLAALPETLRGRVERNQNLAIGWLETRSPEEIQAYPGICALAHSIIAEGFSTAAVTPGVTTTKDLEWWFRERIEELDLDTWFHPTVSLQRAEGAEQARSFARKPGEEFIQRGDLLHVDFGITYLGLNTDQQQHAYVLREGETDAPAGLKQALSVGNRLQDVLTSQFRAGRTGNEILKATRDQAISEGIDPKIYTHPLGFHGHAAGPTIGLWDQQDGVSGAGDYPLHPRTCHSIELNASVAVPEWGGKKVLIMLEEDAHFDLETGVRYLDGRQTSFHLIR